MDKLIQSLRDHATVTNITGGYPVERQTLTGQAADAIEQLQELVRQADIRCDLCGEPATAIDGWGCPACEDCKDAAPDNDNGEAD